MDSISPLLVFVIFLLFLIVFLRLSDADMRLLFYHLVYFDKDFQGQVVWITGASSGIGEHLAYSFAKRRAKLVLSGVNIERLEDVRKRCIEFGKCNEEDVLLLPFLIDDFKVHEECMTKVMEHFGDIDILVNNAGICQREEFQSTAIEVDEKIFKVNVFGALNLTRIVLKHLIAKNKGQIAVTSSVSGKIAIPYLSTYQGSKHALHGYFEGLRKELIHSDVNVSIICPGPVYSRIRERCIERTTNRKVAEAVLKQPDPRMKTDRCSELMLTAIYHKLDECWIAYQPYLTLLYLELYVPLTLRRLIIRHLLPKGEWST